MEEIKNLIPRSSAKGDERETLKEYLINKIEGERIKPNKLDNITLLSCPGNLN